MLRKRYRRDAHQNFHHTDYLIAAEPWESVSSIPVDRAKVP